MNTLRNNLKKEYSQIPNKLITDLNLCNGSLRVMLYLFTKPDDWNVYNADICKQLGISEQTLTKYWKQLLSSGWLKREAARDDKGRLTGGYDYLIGDFTVSIQITESVKSIDYNNNKPINKKETNIVDSFLKDLLSRVKYKSKVTKTKEISSLIQELSKKYNLDNIKENYVNHQIDKGEYSVRITKYLLDYETVYYIQDTKEWYD
jgi:hypothetical protein